MADSNLREPFRLYCINWFLLMAMGVLLTGALALSRFSLKFEAELLKILVLTVSLVVSGRYLISRSWGVRPGFALLSIAQLIVLGSLGGPLTYVAASANFPLQDGALARSDALLGLDWTAYYNFFITRPALLPYAALFYAAFLLPTVLVPLALGFSENFLRLQRFVMASVLTVCVTVLISTLVPAIGTYQHYGLQAEFPGFKASGFLIQLERLPYVREGLLRVLDISEIGGIITFPSFHASVAILALWGFWALWWLRPAALIVYGGMLVATPLVGGHYFVDVLAGVALAFAAICAAIAFREWRVTSSATSQGYLAAE